MKGGKLCSHKCFMFLVFFFFFNLQFGGFAITRIVNFFVLSEIIKIPLNYHLMVILPATCRLQNSITSLMKSMS